MCSGCEDGRKSKKCERKEKKEKKCKDAILINECDINKASRNDPRGYIISKSGTYRLCENINWETSRDNSFAITIGANDVYLDLNGHYIKQIDTSKTLNIAVNVKGSNVKVRNGEFIQLSGGAVLVNNGSKCVLLDKLSVARSCYSGQMPTTLLPFSSAIFCAGTDDLPLSDITVSNCRFCDLGRLGNVFTPSGSVAAILTDKTNNITVSNVNIESLFADAFAIPLNFASGEELLISKVNVSGVDANVFAFGISFTLFDDFVFEDFNIVDLTLTLSPNGPVIPGIDKRGSEGIKISACRDFVIRKGNVQNIVTRSAAPTTLADTVLTTGYSAGELFGELISSQGLLENITVQDVKSDGGQVATNLSNTAGFIGHFANDIRFVQCNVSDIESNIGPVFGFGPKRGSDGSGNVSTDFPTHRNTFNKCVVNNVSSLSEDQNDFAAGYWLASDFEQVIDSSANFVTGANSYGILLDTRSVGATGIGEARNCIIRNNSLVECGSSGILDRTVNKNSAISGTYAAFNGPAGAGPNYSGLNPAVYTSAIQQDWLISAPPSAVPAAGATLANVDIHN